MRLSPLNLKILACILDVEGFDASGVLRHCQVDTIDALDEDGEWVPVELFDHMMASAIELTGDPAFGLVAGKSLALMRYGVLVPLVLPTPSLRQLLADIHRFAVLAVERTEMELVEHAQSAHLLIQPVVHGGMSGHFRMEQVATSALQTLRLVGAGSADILQVDFPYAEPTGQGARYAANFGARIRFEQPTCAIHFNPALLDVRLPSHDPVAYAAARTRAESHLSAMQAGTDMADQVRQWLLEAFPRVPTVPETAGHLGMNERSFRRQLGMLDTSYIALTHECQRLTAERLLAEGQQPLKQIAAALGFSSVHSFHRAFRRWTGLTPSAWRAQQGETV